MHTETEEAGVGEQNYKVCRVIMMQSVQNMRSGQELKAQGKELKAQGATHKSLMSLYDMHS